MNKFFTTIDKVFEWASAIILAFMMVLMVMQVLFRYLLNSPLAWTEELARFAFIWMTFIAGYIAARKGEHVAITVIQDKTPSAISKSIKVIANMISTVFFLIVAYYCLAQWDKLSIQTSSALRIPMSFVYLGMIIGSVVMAIAYLVSAFKSVKES